VKNINCFADYSSMIRRKKKWLIYNVEKFWVTNMETLD